MLLLLLACPPRKTPDTSLPDDTGDTGVSVPADRWLGQGGPSDATLTVSGEAGDQLDRAWLTPEGLYFGAPQRADGEGRVCLDGWPGEQCWTGPHPGSYFGTALAWVGEPAVGAFQDYANGQWAGAVHLLQSGVVLEGAPGDFAGIALDHRERLAIGAFGADTTETDGGMVYLVDQPSEGPDLGDVDFVYGGDPGGQFGIDVEWADLDGDGQPDLLVGAPGATGEIIGTGAAFAFMGPVVAFAGDRDADLVLRGQWSGDQAGKSVSGGDVDGDGVDEWVVASVGVGRVEVLAGQELVATLQGGEEGRLGFSSSLVDLDGDGREDLLLGATREGLGGEVHVLYGPLEGELSGDLVLAAEGEGHKLGIAVGPTDEGFFVGASRVGDKSGAVYLFPGTRP